MSLVSQEALERRVLRTLFDYAQTGSAQLSSDLVVGLIGEQFGEHRIKLALSTLEKQRLVRGNHNARSGSKYLISDAGYKQVEKELLETSEDESSDNERTAPASNRIVGLDHNSRGFLEARGKVSELRDALIKANDLGDLSPREAQVAATEVDQIGETLAQEFFRPAELWRRCLSTLRWVGDQAAAAVVGMLALALLTLLGHLLGFVA